MDFYTVGAVDLYTVGAVDFYTVGAVDSYTVGAGPLKEKEEGVQVGELHGARLPSLAGT